MERAWGEIVRRHAVLRATFPTGDGQPTQVIRPWQPPNLPITDLAGLPEASRESGTAAAGAVSGAEPFDLAAGPVFRASLFRLGAVDHLLLLTFHHIAFDGWSARILRDELARLYAAFCHGCDSPLSPLGLTTPTTPPGSDNAGTAASGGGTWIIGKRSSADRCRYWTCPSRRPRPARPRPPGSAGLVSAGRCGGRGIEGLLPARAGHSLHGVAGRVPGPALPL